jgi:hypothetical protein
MTDIKDIPDELRWRLATEFAARVPAMYDRAFREIAGSRYDGIEQEIWMELSRPVARMVHDFPLPARNAVEIAQTMRTVMIILYGPSWKSEVIELPDDSAVTIVKRCPLFVHEHESGCNEEGTFHRCLALTLSTVPLLNKKYSARYVRTMCTGDRQCEIRIGIEREPDASK